MLHLINNFTLKIYKNTKTIINNKKKHIPSGHSGVMRKPNHGNTVKRWRKIQQKRFNKWMFFINNYYWTNSRIFAVKQHNSRYAFLNCTKAQSENVSSFTVRCLRSWRHSLGADDYGRSDWLRNTGTFPVCVLVRHSCVSSLFLNIFSNIKSLTMCFTWNVPNIENFSWCVPNKCVFFKAQKMYY